MAIQTKKMGWVRTPSAWQATQAWKQRRAAMKEDFSNASATAVNAFASAMGNKIDGTAQLAAEAAATRMQAQIKATLDKWV